MNPGVALPARSLLWLADTATLTDAALAGCMAWLGEDERQRAAGFVRPLRRRQFIAGRVLLRRALAHVSGLAPRSIVLEERPGNAPALAQPLPSPGLGFSISHSGRWAACAVSTACAIGLDIECIDPLRDVLALAEQAFGPAEAAGLRALEGEERTAAFYRMWCLYEAGIKLGRAGAADYLFAYPGLMLAVRSAGVLAPPPLLDIVGLD